MYSAEVVAPKSSDRPDTLQKGLGCAARIGSACCCVVLFLLTAVYFLIVPLGAGDLAVGTFLIIDEEKVRRDTGDDNDITNLTWKVAWPVCGAYDGGEPMSRFDNGCGGECFDSTVLPGEVQTSLAESGGQIVRYPSRIEDGIETVQLGGWLIPAPGNASDNTMAPRIVAVHGFTGNSNEYWMLLVAQNLRELGYHVLIMNFRDHGYSDESQNHIYEWGGAYTYDLLGSWDYLVNDPDGVMGGPISDAKVGILGGSMGAFMTLNAFGLESRVPAAWADSPPYAPKNVFLQGLKGTVASVIGNFGSNFLTWLVGDKVWQAVLDYAMSKGVDLEKNLPEESLPKGPTTRRPLALTTNPADGIVPYSEYQNALALLEDLTDKYKVTHFTTEQTCYGFSHCVSLLVEPDLYKEKLCTFFRTAFQEDASSCSSTTDASIWDKTFIA